MHNAAPTEMCPWMLEIFPEGGGREGERSKAQLSAQKVLRLEFLC